MNTMQDRIADKIFEMYADWKRDAPAGMVVRDICARVPEILAVMREPTDELLDSIACHTTLDGWRNMIDAMLAE